MLHSFQSVDDFLFSIEKEIVDCLYDYNLLSKFDKNAKKVIFYFFVKRISEKLSNDRDLLFYHNSHFSENHELFSHYDSEKLISYLNKISNKVKKITNRIFFLSKKINLPSQAIVNELEGCVIDEVLLLKEKKSVDPKNLKKFLEENSLKDLFNGLSKKVC